MSGSNSPSSVFCYEEFVRQNEVAMFIARGSHGSRLTPRPVPGVVTPQDDLIVGRAANILTAMEYARLMRLSLNEVLDNLIVFADNNLGWKAKFIKDRVNRVGGFDSALEIEEQGRVEDGTYKCAARARKGTKMHYSLWMSIDDIKDEEAPEHREIALRNPAALLESRAIRDFSNRHAQHLFTGGDVATSGDRQVDIPEGAAPPPARPASDNLDDAARQLAMPASHMSKASAKASAPPPGNDAAGCEPGITVKRAKRGGRRADPVTPAPKEPERADGAADPVAASVADVAGAAPAPTARPDRTIATFSGPPIELNRRPSGSGATAPGGSDDEALDRLIPPPQTQMSARF